MINSSHILGCLLVSPQKGMSWPFFPVVWLCYVVGEIEARDVHLKSSSLAACTAHLTSMGPLEASGPPLKEADSYQEPME
jgi:hypothetical protein